MFESEDSDEGLASTSSVKKSAQADVYTPGRRPPAKPKKDVVSPEMAQVLDASKLTLSNSANVSCSAVLRSRC